MKIWKYSLHTGIKQQCLDVPQIAIPRHLGMQGGMVALWAQVDPEGQTSQVEVVCVATGEPVPEGYSYLGTIQFPNGLVFHYFWTR